VPHVSDDTVFPIPCPRCAHKTEQPFGSLKRNPTITCSACGHRYSIQGDGAVADVVTHPDEMNRLLDEDG
jgi:DNA-directed RNA polymerase subunit RPC12/RpoP